MGNQVAEIEKQQAKVINESKTAFSKLEASYKEAEGLIGSIKKKQAVLIKTRNKLWTTVVVMAFVILIACIIRKTMY